MSDEETKVGRNFAPTIRPLAKPEHFLLAPMMCGVFCDMTMLLLGLIAITKLGWPGFVRFVPLMTHASLILLGLFAAA